MKITVEVPSDLLKKAQRASRKSVAETVRMGLELLVDSSVYARLLKLRGKVAFSKTVTELKDDR